MESSAANSGPVSEQSKLPAHIAIVMDGNGRWAENRNRPRTLGHQAGLKALRRIVEHCGRLNIPELTIFAFSSENWNRPPNEVNRLMDLFMKALDKEARELNENGVRLCFIGDLSAFSEDMQASINRAMQQSEQNQRMRLNVAVNYGGRWDITQAARALAAACKRGELDPADIDESALSQKLMLSGRNDPDLFIRTGGEMRISNFLLWQSAYTEFHFTPTLWPDFSPESLDAALEDYMSRERRFGRTGKQIRRQAS
ncbi:MAG TPA: polyprenyl diphosphate synthase [Xanthomonadales bacterium]|nr:polyprenyl diphosphate synthase [Xanthomonadales bacterium]